jgi:hypothetical protein
MSVHGCLHIRAGIRAGMLPELLLLLRELLMLLG